MKFLLPLFLLTALVAAPAFADCSAPSNEVKVPDGAAATKDEMIAAQRAVKDYNDTVKNYIDCITKEMDAKVAAGGDKLNDAERQKISKEYADMQNAAVERVQKVADKFNVELRAWKAKNAPPAAPAQ
jgi:hypothetical protein